MFSEFVEARVGGAGRKRWAIVISMVSQTAVLAALLLTPLLYTDALPNPLSSIKALFVPMIPLVEVSKPPEVPAQAKVSGRRFFENGILRPPTHIPPMVAIFQNEELAPQFPATLSTDYGATNILDVLNTARSEAEPPPVVPMVPPPTQRIRQSQIERAMILEQTQPVYPSWLRGVRIQGDVILHAIIDREGRVTELEVVSGHPLLARAALDAVRTWRYRPTLLNGEPVEVETTITVSFVLGR